MFMKCFHIRKKKNPERKITFHEMDLSLNMALAISSHIKAFCLSLLDYHYSVFIFCISSEKELDKPAISVIICNLFNVVRSIPQWSQSFIIWAWVYGVSLIHVVSYALGYKNLHSFLISDLWDCDISLSI